MFLDVGALSHPKASFEKVEEGDQFIDMFLL
jgi:hypothetical protein